MATIIYLMTGDLYKSATWGVVLDVAIILLLLF